MFINSFGVVFGGLAESHDLAEAIDFIG